MVDHKNSLILAEAFAKKKKKKKKDRSKSVFDGKTGWRSTLLSRIREYFIILGGGACVGRGTWRSRIRVGFLSASPVLNGGEPGLPAPGDVPKDIRLRAKIAWRCQRQGEMKKSHYPLRPSTIFYLPPRNESTSSWNWDQESQGDSFLLLAPILVPPQRGWPNASLARLLPD